MSLKHGMYGTPTYKSWAEMKWRCGKKCWKNVTYAKEWETFEGFFKDMGERPKGMTLDRINVRGNYCKENCRWADNETQQNNKSSNVYYEIDGEKLTLYQIARRYNVSRSNLANKIYINKWDMITALNYLIGMKGGVTYR